jgi:NADH-quinone oxidoreductase subunit M
VLEVVVMTGFVALGHSPIRTIGFLPEAPGAYHGSRMSALSNHLLSILLVTPLAGALLILFVGCRQRQVIRLIANGCATATLALAIPLWFRYEPHGKTWQFAERGEWIPMFGASYYVGVDGFSILLILLTALIGWIAIMASWDEIESRVKQFYALVLILQTGLLGVFMSLDFLQVFVFWETVLVSMSFLIRVWGEGRPVGSAIKFAVYTVAASLLVLLGIVILYFVSYTVTGAYSLDITQLHTVTIPVGLQRWVFLAFVLGFAGTMALFPLHRWLPDAQAHAPTAASLILAGVLLKMGAYGFIRFSLPILPDASRDFAPAMTVVAIVALACGALVALRQRDWIRVVAYSSVCHMPIVILGTFALTPVSFTGSMLHQINHGISTAGLLLAAIMIRRLLAETRPVSGEPRGGSGEARPEYIPSVRRLWQAAPVRATILLIMTFSLAGVPALNGFVSEVMIVQGVATVSKPAAIVAAFGIVFVATYILWLCGRTTFGRNAGSPDTRVRELTAREVAMFVPLVALAFWIGLYPAPFVSRVETSMGRAVARVNPAYAPYVAQGSDCATAAPPEPSGPPPGFVLTESCADGR